METEEIVTKILTEREILKKKRLGFVSNPDYNLKEYLKNPQPEINPYDSRFVFIK